MGTDQKITLCHIVSGDLWAGAEVQACNIICSLDSLALFDVTAVLLNEGELASRLRNHGVEVIVASESSHGFYSILSELKSHFRGRQFDIIHSHRYKENLLALLLKRHGLTNHLVQTVHGVGEKFRGVALLKASFYSALESYLVMPKFDRVHVVSHDIESSFRSRVDSSRLVTIHNAIDSAHIEPRHSSGDVRHELGIGRDVPLIGSVGRMVPVKGFEIFLAAAKGILESRPETMFILVGDGPELLPLKKNAAKLGIEKSVIFAGFRNDAVDIINAMDLFVVSSYHEGIPTVILEAMKLRTGVVATSVGGITEVIRNNISGILVEPGASEDIARECLRVLADPELKARLEREAETTIAGGFTIEHQRNQLAQMYTEMVASGD